MSKYIQAFNKLNGFLKTYMATIAMHRLALNNYYLETCNFFI